MLPGKLYVHTKQAYTLISHIVQDTKARSYITVASHEGHGVPNQGQLDYDFQNTVQAKKQDNIKASYNLSLLGGIHR